MVHALVYGRNNPGFCRSVGLPGFLPLYARFRTEVAVRWLDFYDRVGNYFGHSDLKETAPEWSTPFKISCVWIFRLAQAGQIRRARVPLGQGRQQVLFREMRLMLIQ